MHATTGWAPQWQSAATTLRVFIFLEELGKQLLTFYHLIYLGRSVSMSAVSTSPGRMK